MFPHRFGLAVGLFCAFFPSVPYKLAAQPAPAVPAPAPAVLQVDGLGKGTAPLDGPWQFHVGDNPSFARPEVADATGTGGWEPLSADKTWGAQGHPAYTGYAWYRKHLHFSPAPGASPEFFLLFQRVDDVYEVYWNGRLVGHNGKMPPDPSYYYAQPAQIVGLGQAGDGVLALRVWKAPLNSFDSDQLGGLSTTPLAGSLDAIVAQNTELDYAWLRSHQYEFGLTGLYALIMILSLLAWLRDRSRGVLLAMAAFSGSPVLGLLLVGLHLPLSYRFALGTLQPVLGMKDIGLWFLLLYLLELDDNRRLARLTRQLAVVCLTVTSLDGLLTVLDWSNPRVTTAAQLADAVLTIVFMVAQMYPFLLLAFGLRKRLDSARWLVALAAFLTETLFALRLAAEQGSRFTHWTLSEKIAKPLFYFNGNAFTPQMVTDSLLLLAIIYAVYCYMRETLRRQGALEQEFQSARELQKVLIPETLPELPGFAVTSVYRPAQEVGGDFFQLIPLEGAFARSTLIVLGDVSGKGLRAAMTVSMIVGTVRTLARFEPRPAAMLAELNLRLCGRLQGGFTTCLAMLLSHDGRCMVASAGHPPPFLNQRELSLPGALPLGIVPGIVYQESALRLQEGDHFALYTDGLLEARNVHGEIFSFERLDALFARRPGAAEATEAAVRFGQEDDITVLTVTRLASGVQSTTQLTIPVFAGT